MLGLLGWFFDKYNLLPFFGHLLIFISFFIVEPFLRFSIYPPEKDNDKLAEFVQQHCCIKIFKLFEHVKTKMKFTR